MDLESLKRMTRDSGQVLESERLPKLDVGRKHQFRSETRRIYVPAYGDSLEPSQEKRMACSGGWEYIDRGRSYSAEAVTERRLAIAEHQIAALKESRGRKGKTL